MLVVGGMFLPRHYDGPQRAIGLSHLEFDCVELMGGTLRAAEGMGCGELCPTGTVTGESSGLPSIRDTQCIPESLLVEGEPMFLNWKSHQPCRCSLF